MATTRVYREEFSIIVQETTGNDTSVKVIGIADCRFDPGTSETDNITITDTYNKRDWSFGRSDLRDQNDNTFANKESARQYLSEFIGGFNDGGGNGQGVARITVNLGNFATFADLETASQNDLSQLFNSSTQVTVGTVTNTAVYEWGGETNPGTYTNRWFVRQNLSGISGTITPGFIPKASTSNSVNNSALMETANRIISTKTIQTPDASLEIGNFQLSNYGFTIGALERASNRVFLPINYELTPQGSTNGIILNFAEEGIAPVTNATNANETFTGNLQFTTPVLATGVALDYRLTSASATADCNIIIRIIGHDHEPAIFDYKRATGGVGFDLTSGENIIDLPIPLFFRQNVTLYVTIESSNTLQLQGETVSGQQVPLASANAQLSTDEIIATRNWVTGELTIDASAFDGNLDSTITTLQALANAVDNLPLGGNGPSDEHIRDLVGALLVAGSNVSIEVDDNANTITIGAVNTQRTDEEIRDVVGSALVAGTNISIVVDDENDTITINSTGGGSTPIPVSTDLRFGVSTVENPANVDFASLTDEASPTDPFTLNLTTTADNQYLHIYTSNTHPIISITENVLNELVYQQGGSNNIFTLVENVRNENSIIYDSLSLGPLVNGISKTYTIRFS